MDNIINSSNVEMLRNAKNNVEITLNEYIKAYYDRDILQYDNTALEEIQKVVDLTIDLINTNGYTFRHTGTNVYEGRINEFGNAIEDVFVYAFEKVTGFKPRNLGVGYPDAHIFFKGQHFYFEFKIQANIDASDGLRIFYTSLPTEKTMKNKDIQDGFHILISFEHNGPGKLSGRYNVKDLYGLKYKHEVVQQCGSKSFHDIKTIVNA